MWYCIIFKDEREIDKNDEAAIDKNKNECYENYSSHDEASEFFENGYKIAGTI